MILVSIENCSSQVWSEHGGDGCFEIRVTELLNKIHDYKNSKI